MNIQGKLTSILDPLCSLSTLGNDRGESFPIDDRVWNGPLGFGGILED